MGYLPGFSGQPTDKCEACAGREEVTVATGIVLQVFCVMAASPATSGDAREQKQRGCGTLPLGYIISTEL